MDRDKLAKLLTSAMERHTSWEDYGDYLRFTIDCDVDASGTFNSELFAKKRGWTDNSGKWDGLIHKGRYFTPKELDDGELRWYPVVEDRLYDLEMGFTKDQTNIMDHYIRRAEEGGKEYHVEQSLFADGAQIVTIKLGTTHPLYMRTDGNHHNHVLTLFDLLALMAAQDARSAGRDDDVAALMAALPHPPITDAQATEILAHTNEDRPMIVKSGKRYTEAMGADSRHRMWKDDSGFFTTAGGNDGLTIFNTEGNEVVANAGTGKLLSHLNAVIHDRGLECGPDEVLRVSTSYADILSAYNLADTPGNRSRIRKNLQALKETAFRWTDAWGTEHDVPIRGGDVKTKRDGTILFTFSPDFITLVMGHNAGMLAVDRLLMTTDDKAHPHAFAIGHRLTTHAFINAEKANRYRLSVDRLLAHVKSIPTYEDVKSRAYTRRIIEPLERDLDYLVELGVLDYWDYCHANGEPLTDEEQAARIDDDGNDVALPYDMAKNCLIEWRPVHPYDGHAQALTDARARNRQARAKCIDKAAK